MPETEHCNKTSDPFSTVLAGHELVITGAAEVRKNLKREWKIDIAQRTYLKKMNEFVEEAMLYLLTNF